MGQDLEPIDDDQGRSLGCIATIGGVLFAIQPDGTMRECRTRYEGVQWLEQNSGLKAAVRGPDIVEYAALTVFVMGLVYIAWLWAFGP